MNTQQGTEVPHICTALDHCHKLNERVSDMGARVTAVEDAFEKLNERVADLEGWLRLVDGGTQRAHEDINALRELTNRMQGDAAQWNNALAAESRKHAEALDAHRELLDALDQPRPARTAPNCGGCAGHGAHKRWCPEVVGEKAARLGRWAEEADSLGDRIGANDPMAANACYNAASRLSGMAQLARVER